MQIRTLIYAIAAPAALAVSLLGATAASASAGPNGSGTTGTPGNSSITKLTDGSIQYGDWYFADGGQVQCREVHHANVKAGQNFDSVSCARPDGLPLSRPAGEAGTVGWVSDFTGNINVQTTLHYTVSADGLSYTGYTDNYPVPPAG
jgi:hypothetical protein